MDPTGLDRSPDEMIGRHVQEAFLDELLEALTVGRPTTLMLTGDAGMGKTRLADELVRRARGRGWRTAWVTAWQGDGVPALWPWADLLRQIAGAADVLERPTPGTDPGSAASARFAQFDAVVHALRRGIDGRPLVVVLDDAHWADPATIQLAAFASSALRDQPLLLMLTYRQHELGHDELALLTRLGPTLALPPLTDAAVGELVTGVVGQPVPASVAAVITARSNGNPLFVREFARLLAMSGRTTVAPSGVPEGIAAVIERRLARLPEPVVDLLRVGAVIGPTFSADTASAVSGIEPVGVVGLLDPAVASGVLNRTSSGYEFGHDLIRQVSLDSIGAPRRATLHAAVAAHHRGRLPLDPTRHAAIADHLSQAGPTHGREASGHWVSAAEHALERLAYEDAAACFHRALALENDDAQRRCRLLLDQGGALLLAGALADARRCFDQAAETARGCGRADLLAEAALGLGVGGSGWEVPIWDAHQVRLVRDALDALDPADRRMRSMLLARLSVAAATPDSLEECRALAEDALSLARLEDDAGLVAQALGSLCDALGAPEHSLLRLEHSGEIIRAAGRAKDPVLELLGRRFLVVSLLELGRFDDLDREIVVFERLVREVRQPLIGWYAPLFRGMRALLAGDLDEAERRQCEVAAAARSTGSVNADLLSATLLVGIDLARERPVSGDFMLRYDIDPVVWASYGACLALVALTHGNRVEAARLLRMHAHDGFARVGRDAEHLTTMMMFVRVAVAIDDRAALRSANAILAPFSGRWIVDGIAAVCWGPVDLELARIAAALGDAEGLDRHRSNARRQLALVNAPLVSHALEMLTVRAVADDRSSVAAVARSPVTEQTANGTTGPQNVLRRDGEVWTLSFADVTVRMRDAKGLQDLARLVARPGQEHHVLDLLAPVAAAGPAHPTGRKREARRVPSDLGPLIDETARRQYRRRLDELDEDIAEAEARNDRGRAESLAAEREAFVGELVAATGLGGRGRRVGAESERARKAVGTRVRLTLERMELVHPLLARHLRNAVHMGVYCAYQPERPTAWVTR